jgi:hypothetical protein
MKSSLGASRKAVDWTIVATGKLTLEIRATQNTACLDHAAAIRMPAAKSIA